MYLLSHVYYWASQGCPDAVPAGIVAINLGPNEADLTSEDAQEWRGICSSYGLLDNKAWQLDFSIEDVDLVRKDCGDEKHISYLENIQIVPDWQWHLIKQQPGLKYKEHDLAEHIEEMEAFDPE